MPISALPPATVQAIGSTSVISDPCSMIKELLDNALDASASSIAIEISQNTIDLIHAKDNGHGISSEDYPLVCKRASTSKIQTVEDLMRIGGKSLGFRGEALASAVEVSGGLTITTRVKSESVGSSNKYSRNGELISSQRASHPVGTSIRIVDVFKHIPVRRQTALRNSAKTLIKIKKLIQTYAMTRPSIRLSLKVLKARSENSNWVYAPSQNSNVIDAVMKILGTDVATNCIYREWSSSPTIDLGSKRPNNPKYQIDAFLLKPNSDHAKYNNLGQYISIDGRPISASRGIAHDIAKLYKSHLRSIYSSNKRPHPSINDSFLCMQIWCPEASYDVNIEPAKDDVLFEEPKYLLSLVDKLFQDVYGENASLQGEQSSEQPCREVVTHSELEMGPLTQVAQSTSTQHEKSTSSAQQFTIAALPLSESASFRCTPDPQTSHRCREADSTVSIQSSDLEPSGSPMARNLNAVSQYSIRPIAQKNISRPISVHVRRQMPVHDRMNSTRMESPRTEGSCLPSPTSSSTSATSPSTESYSPPTIRPSPPALHGVETAPALSLRDLLQRNSRARDKERYGNGSLDTWFLKSSQAARARGATGDHPSGEHERESKSVEPSLSRLTQERFGAQEASSPSSPHTMSEPMSPETAISDPTPRELELRQVTTSPPQRAARGVNKGQGQPVLERWGATLHSLSEKGHDSDLEMALDFEKRKKAAIQQRRNELKKQSKATKNTNSPHLSRYLAARAALASDPNHDKNREKSNGAKTSFEPLSNTPIFDPRDPRSYLIRQRNAQETSNSQSETPLKRTNMDNLPFEVIPEMYDLHNIGITQPVDISYLSISFKESSKSDLYTQGGETIDAFPSPSNLVSEDFKRWSDRLSTLMETHYRNKDGDTIPSLQFDFSPLGRLPEYN